MALKPADFQRVLSTRAWSRSDYFSLHRSLLTSGVTGKGLDKLSTGSATVDRQLVDESAMGEPNSGTIQAQVSVAAISVAAKLTGAPTPSVAAVLEHRLGLVVPKRLARRAVTRNLIKRQARAAWCEHGGKLPPGDWVVRLRAPIAREQFPSATSEALRRLLVAELRVLFQSALRQAQPLQPSGSSQAGLATSGPNQGI